MPWFWRQCGPPPRDESDVRTSQKDVCDTPNHIALVDEITNFRLAGLTGEICLNDHCIHMFNCDRTRGGHNFSNGILNGGLRRIALRLSRTR